MKKLQKSLLKSADEIDLLIKKVGNGQMMCVFSEMSEKLRQYGRGNEKGFHNVSVYNLMKWVEKNKKI